MRSIRSEIVTQEDLNNIKKWANLLEINITELLELASRKALPEKEMQLRDWASLFAIRLLEKAGLDIIFDGEAHRIEMYEYPVRHCKGFTFYGHVRSFDNKYYLKAACTGRVGVKDLYHLKEFRYVSSKTDREVKIPVTGPYTLADWSFNEYYLRKRFGQRLSLRQMNEEAKREFTLDLAREIIRPNLKALSDAGAKILQIDEPAATTHLEEIPLFVEAYNEATEGIDSKMVLHICYSDYRVLFPHIVDLKNCSQFAWEFANRDNKKHDGYETLKLFKEYRDKREIGLGVIDVHRNEIEEPKLIKERIMHATKILDDPRRVYVNPDCGLRTRTWEVAFQKLKNMAEGANLARRELGN